MKYPAPKAPPRWTDPHCYYPAMRGVWEVEREYNLLLGKSGLKAALRRFWLRFCFVGIHVWTDAEREEIRAAGKL